MKSLLLKIRIIHFTVSNTNPAQHPASLQLEQLFAHCLAFASVGVRRSLQLQGRAGGWLCWEAIISHVITEFVFH